MHAIFSYFVFFFLFLSFCVPPLFGPVVKVKNDNRTKWRSIAEPTRWTLAEIASCESGLLLSGLSSNAKSILCFVKKTTVENNWRTGEWEVWLHYVKYFLRSGYSFFLGFRPTITFNFSEMKRFELSIEFCRLRISRIATVSQPLRLASWASQTLNENCNYLLFT